MQRRCRRDQRQERQKRHAGEIIPRQSRDKPPAPPWFRRRLRRSAGRECGCRTSCGGRALGKVGTADAGVLGGRGSVCGRSAGVSLRTHLRWPTPVRPLPDSRVKGRDFRMFCWRRTRLDVIELISVQQPGGKCLPENRLSTLWGPRPVLRRSRRRWQVAGIYFRR